MGDELQNIGYKEFVLWLLRLRRRVRVEGNSMAPLLKPGDELLINPRAYRHNPPNPGDIVVAQHPYRPNLRLIKRVEGGLQNGRYILKGDNPAESSDSRAFGAVAAEQIVGQVTGKF